MKSVARYSILVVLTGAGAFMAVGGWLELTERSERRVADAEATGAAVQTVQWPRPSSPRPAAPAGIEPLAKSGVDAPADHTSPQPPHDERPAVRRLSRSENRSRPAAPSTDDSDLPTDSGPRSLPRAVPARVRTFQLDPPGTVQRTPHESPTPSTVDAPFPARTGRWVPRRDSPLLLGRAGGRIAPPERVVAEDPGGTNLLDSSPTRSASGPPPPDGRRRIAADDPGTQTPSPDSNTAGFGLDSAPTPQPSLESRADETRHFDGPELEAPGNHFSAMSRRVLRRLPPDPAGYGMDAVVGFDTTPRAWDDAEDTPLRLAAWPTDGNDVWVRHEVPTRLPAVDVGPETSFPVATQFLLAQRETGGATDAAAASDDASGSDGERSEDEPIGQAPPEDAERLFIRDTSLVLKPGEVQTELSGIYLMQEGLGVRVLSNGVPVLERVRGRLFLVPFSIRYGLCKNTELFATAPFGMSLLERDNLAQQNTDEAGMMGDVTLGMVRQLPWHGKKGFTPAATFSVGVPTGARGLRTLSGNDASLGSGVFRLAGALSFVESHDPVATFGGVGYQYLFVDHVAGVAIERQGGLNYYLGIGFAISDDFSLSCQLNGYYQDETKIDGVPVPDTDIEPVSLRFSIMRRLTRKSRIQPFVEIGLNRDASDYLFGFRFIHDEPCNTTP